MARFLISPTQITEELITLSKEESHHAIKTLRLRLNDEVELLDGCGSVITAIITEMASMVTCKTIHNKNYQINPPHIHLYPCILKGKKMDIVVQKATELGVSTITPMLSEFTVAKPPTKSRLERWQKISKESCKQCGNPFFLTINDPQPFKQCLKRGQDKGIIFYECETKNIITTKQKLPNLQNCHIYLGPEGGFSLPEIAMAATNNISPISFGPQILRAETAAITATSIISFLAGTMAKPWILQE